MDVIVIRRNHTLQLTAEILLGGRKYHSTVERFLEAGKKDGGDSVTAFFTHLEAGDDIDACFAAMEDRPDLDPETELAEKLESGKQELLTQVRQFLEGKITIAEEASRQLTDLAIGEVSMREPAEGQGICRVCFETFRLHYIGGSNDLCMSHINPGLI